MKRKEKKRKEKKGKRKNDNCPGGVAQWTSGTEDQGSNSAMV
jgi:hypothetical protein